MTLYLEHLAGDYFLVDDEDQLWKVWPDGDFTNRKLNNAVKKIEKNAPEKTEVVLKAGRGV